jgi:hypothetical protein
LEAEDNKSIKLLLRRSVQGSVTTIINKKTFKMKNEQLYKKTVDILVDAYFNDTLQNQNCYACAVGNIVAANIGMEFEKIPDPYFVEKVVWPNTEYPGAEGWAKVFCSTVPGYQRLSPDYYCGEAKRQIDSTGYSWHELAQIEKSFEIATKGRQGDVFMFNGLMAVIDVLDEIHENKDAEVSKESKARFNKVDADKRSVASKVQ